MIEQKQLEEARARVNSASKEAFDLAMAALHDRAIEIDCLKDVIRRIKNLNRSYFLWNS
jgi:hypothetical protein